MAEEILRITQFGNRVLRNKSIKLSIDEIKSPKIQRLITDLKNTLKNKKLGVGLAAPQVGKGLSLSVIVVQPTKHRPKVEPLELVIINPKILKTFGYRTQLWEGCISSGDGSAGLFAKVPRYKKVQIEFLDERARKHRKIFEGLPAHVIQHEIDHLNGVLFVDRVKDTSTYMTMKEYKKMVSNKERESSAKKI